MKTLLDPKMEAALNKQANAELWSAYLYLSMSYDMKDKGFDGIANWFAIQSREELEHAQRFMDYIVQVDGKVILTPINEVKQEWNSPLEAFEDTLMQEKLVTDRIYELMDMAVELKDYATQSMLRWFVDEQVEEEDTPRSLLQALKMIGDDKAAMYMFDKKLGKRKED